MLFNVFAKSGVNKKHFLKGSRSLLQLALSYIVDRVLRDSLKLSSLLKGKVTTDLIWLTV